LALGKRRIVQVLTAIAQNGYFKGFAEGRIYRGASKKFCVPGLNCYSCPGALGACPLGAMQSLSINPQLNFSLYVYGFILLVGVIAGRFVCGFLCPFGLLQELLHKIPLKKFRENKVFAALNKLKYIVLLVFVIGIPTYLTVTKKIGFPAFCQWLCPAGTLEAGLPLVMANSQIGSAVGPLFVWKVAVLLLVVLLSIKIFRPFCRFLCPLGALYSLLNRVSIVHIETEQTRCDKCGECAASCPMHTDSPDSLECIRCGKCVKNCGAKAKKWSVKRGGQ
jgi:polyferredoxin